MSGTLGNLGCDKKTGECNECKRNVEGEKCDRCKKGFFGLSREDPDGCRPCDCKSGLSSSNYCDPITGECQCQDVNLSGERCEQIKKGYFCPNVDFLTFEAEEFEVLNENARIIERSDYEFHTWTGIGSVQMFDQAKIKKKFTYVFKSGLFDVVLRYDWLMYDWSPVQVKILSKGLNRTAKMTGQKINRICPILKPDQNRVEQKLIHLDKCL